MWAGSYFFGGFHMGRFHNLTGQRFGRLTVIERAADKVTGSKPKVMWRCKCDCGKEVIVWSSSLVQGTTVSCGCKTKKHGFAHKERLYETWKNMRRRCLDPKNKRYAQYGGRGITVCPEWGDYATFREWAMASGYKDDLTIDRIDVDGNYCPENCRWANAEVQANNVSRNRMLSYGGKSMTMAQWARKLKVTYSALNHRVQKGQNMEEIVRAYKGGEVV